MATPGEYVADVTEGISCVEDLPAPKQETRSRNAGQRSCPRCGHQAFRHRVFTRKLHDLGDVVANRPRDLLVTYSQHYCTPCKRFFNTDLSDLALPGSHYTLRVVALAVRLVVEDGLPYRPASWHLWRDHRVFVPFATIQNWVEEAGKKKRSPRHE
jgi:hypothetical protein